MAKWLPTAAVAAIAAALVACSPGSDIAAVELPESPRPVSAQGADRPESDRAEQPTERTGGTVRNRTADITSPPSLAPTPEGAEEEIAMPPAKGEFPAPPTGKPAGRPSKTSFKDSPRANDTDAPARLVGVTVDERDGWEEVTFTFADTTTVPTYEVSYVDWVRPHEEADPIPMSGNAFMQVDFSATDPNTDGQMTVPSDLRPEQAQVKELVLAENLGGELRFGIGLAGQDGFHVQELKSPTRLVIQLK